MSRGMFPEGLEYARDNQPEWAGCESVAEAVERVAETVRRRVPPDSPGGSAPFAPSRQQA